MQPDNYGDIVQIKAYFKNYLRRNNYQNTTKNSSSLILYYIHSSKVTVRSITDLDDIFQKKIKHEHLLALNHHYAAGG